MKFNKNKASILVMVMILLALNGCGKKQNIETEEYGVNFYKEYYHPEKKHREEEITLEEGCKEIEIQGTTISGTIHVTLENKSEQDIKYEYDVEGSLAETIEIEENDVDDQWVLCTDINEETEGSLRLLFH